MHGKLQTTKTEENRQEYINRRNEAKQTVRAAKKKSWERDIEENFRQHKKNFGQ